MSAAIQLFHEEALSVQCCAVLYCIVRELQLEFKRGGNPDSGRALKAPDLDWTMSCPFPSHSASLPAGWMCGVVAGRPTGAAATS